MRDKKIMQLMILSGIGSMLIGLPYILNIYSSNRFEVSSWGISAVFLGIFLVASSVAVGHIGSRASRMILALEYSVLVILQVPLILLWAFYDTTPAGETAARWYLAVPHVILMLMGVLVVCRLLQFSFTKIRA
ncbi:MAG: hypothetical protein H0Z40_10950 [Desulfotomaculum sp.]|nr:hypothetical protein [Desulfotomaculum sp.]